MEINIGNAVRQIQSLLNEFITLLPNLLLAIIVLAIFYGIGRYLIICSAKISERAQWGKGVGILLGRFGHYCSLLFGLLVALSIVVPSFTVKDLVQVLGVGGVAIGFAFKDIFQNFLAGILIIVGRPFRIGDQIQVKNFEGVVEDIQVRATKIRTSDNRQIVIPNTTLYTAEVTVLTAYPRRKTSIDIGISYNDDIDVARRIILDSLKDCPNIDQDPAPEVAVAALQDYSVILRVRWWTSSKNSDIGKGKATVLPRLKTALTQKGIDMPFPTRTILFHDQTAKTEREININREAEIVGAAGSVEVTG